MDSPPISSLLPGCNHFSALESWHARRGVSSAALRQLIADTAAAEPLLSSAAHREHLAGDPGGIVRGEEQDGMSDVLGRAEAA